jgi:hypothetical protein
LRWPVVPYSFLLSFRANLIITVCTHRKLRRTLNQARFWPGRLPARPFIFPQMESNYAPEVRPYRYYPEQHRC